VAAQLFQVPRNNCIVSLNGVVQAPVGAFTVSGSTITFASTLSATDVIDFILILGNVFDIGTPTNGSVGLAQLSATGTKDATTFLRGDNTFASAGPAAGQIIQVVTDKKTTAFSTSTQNVYVTTSQTLSITPSSASNKILVMFNAGSVTTLAANTSVGIEVRRGATVVCFGGYYTATVGGNQTVPFGVIHTLDSPNTTSSVTYEVFAAEGGIPGTVSVNADRVLTLLEVKG
jgi:hypothetical protein